MGFSNGRTFFPRFFQVMLPLLVVMFMTAPALADENTTSFPMGETSIELGNQWEVKVDNSEQSTISISSKDEKLYSNEIAFGKVEALFETSHNGNTFVTVMYRLDGSGNILYYEVLQQVNDQLEQVFSSEMYERATFELSGDVLKMTYPIFAEGDSVVDPTRVAVDQYIYGEGIKKDVIASSGKEISKSLQSANPVTVVGTNPSPAEINRILTEEAVKLNIPPEIVKAIAYQEATWAQYWNTGSVPVNHYESVCTPERAAVNKNILAWDGTNVKLGYDCIGIGIMQVSDWRSMPEGPAKQQYIEKLKTDIRFNISEGLKILESKWLYSNSIHSDGKPLIPSLNNNNREMIDNWYFAAMAYNGMLSRNDPTINPVTAYQSRIMSHIENLGLIKVTPFPIYELTTNILGASLLRFENPSYGTSAPLTTTKAKLTPGVTAYTNEVNVNVRSINNVNTVLYSVPKGTQVTVLSGQTQYPNSLNNHFTFVPVKLASGQTGYITSSYLDPTKSVKSYSLAGLRRYETGVSISNHGWQREQPQAVVLGRGDLPIDSLTGSVLAAHLDSPLLLTMTDALPEAVMNEIIRLKPQTVYLLGGEGAISKNVENYLTTQMGLTVKRLNGANRNQTASSVANEFTGTSVNEIFLATGNEKSPDALSIAPYAGSQSIPILLTDVNKLPAEVVQFIKAKNVKKVTIIGGVGPVSNNVAAELRGLGAEVIRVSGSDRYATSVEIAKKYYPQNEELTHVFFARGDEIVDALSGSAMAAKYNSPIILTRSTAIPPQVSTYLNSVNAIPTYFYLGSENVITPQVRQGLEKNVLN
ncbi:cell wall-binding repeat-containing protein [Jeotgalibacillus soli]|uniref:SH3b domain-containing protein n=1 Tax=Jeotgalibacillus soli TaxID=889306 RepID=A0A0C2VZU7_9BACL|nr:cell wall-binding repeat-containing protein [Jeotgalibacillus soli]KIL49891.1 hypothetical protein KP78_13590 [Jeotgalibacillus soli]